MKDCEHLALIMDLFFQAQSMQQQGKLLDLVDPTLGGNFNVEEAHQMLNLALACTSLTPSARPAMSSLVSILQNHTPVEIESHETRSWPMDILSHEDMDQSLDSIFVDSSSTPSVTTS